MKCFATGLFFFLIAFGAIAAVPYSFQNGQTADANQVNSNFNDVEAKALAALGSMQTQKVTGVDYGVSAAICPSNSIVLSANCLCDDDDGNSNFGKLFGCIVSGNGAVAGCFPDGVTFDSRKNDPVAEVVAVCLSATSQDGQPFFAVTKSANDTDVQALEESRDSFLFKLSSYRSLLGTE